MRVYVFVTYWLPLQSIARTFLTLCQWNLLVLQGTNVQHVSIHAYPTVTAQQHIGHYCTDKSLSFLTYLRIKIKVKKKTALQIRLLSCGFDLIYVVPLQI